MTARLKKGIKDNLTAFAAILGLAAIALPVALFIAHQQRLRIPFIDPKPMRLKVVMEEANSVTPGQGQTAQIAGVQVGQIGKVELRDGRAVVTLEIEPKYKGYIHDDARALLRPRTGLKDMFVQIFPGSERRRVLRDGDEIAVANTATDVDLDEILAELDVRTREYLRLFIAGAGTGLRNRGGDLAEVFRRYGQTTRDLGTVNRAVAGERNELRRVITNLALLNGKLAEKPRDVSELVTTSAATFRAFASEDDKLRSTVTELGPTLRQASTTFRDVRPLAGELGPTTRRLVPVFQQLTKANRQVQPFAREAAPILAKRIRPFLRAARPLTRDLRPAAQSLSATFPELRRSGRVLNRFFNMLAFNPGGAEGPDVQGREEGFLFWLAWVSHQGLNLQSVEDANGPLRPVFLTGNCATLTSLVTGQPQLEFGLNLSPVLATVCGNPRTASVDPALAGQVLPQLAPYLPKTKAGAAGQGTKR